MQRSSLRNPRKSIPSYERATGRNDSPGSLGRKLIVRVLIEFVLLDRVAVLR